MAPVSLRDRPYKVSPSYLIRYVAQTLVKKNTGIPPLYPENGSILRKHKKGNICYSESLKQRQLPVLRLDVCQGVVNEQKHLFGIRLFIDNS
jgi:hypothetical protein